MERAQGPRPVRSGAVLIATLLIGVVFTAAAQAAPGDLDPTFGSGGKQRTDFGLSLSNPAAIARQPDGKLVAVGYVGTTHGTNFALARYNTDGTLDTSFSGNGKQTTDFGTGGEGATGVAVRGDGKIVVVGSVGAGSNQRFAIARYTPNGSLDPNFSGDGKQTTDFGGNAGAHEVALQGDGKVVAVGSGGGGGIVFFALARYNPNGTLDASFSGDGKQTTDFVGGGVARGVAVQGDGRILAAGHAGDPGESDFALARYNPNGTLDPSFSGDGRQTTDFGAEEFGLAVALQGDGKIVTAGTASGGGFSDFALARYNSNGSLDPSFSGDGKQTTDFAGVGDGANGVALQGNGKIVAVGGAGSSDFALARYNPNGTLDTSFSGDGKQTTAFGACCEGARGVVLPGDGKIVAVGRSGGGRFGLARYTTDGSLDPSFSGDGKQTTAFGGLDQANGVAIQADGRIVAVGGTGIPSSSSTGQGADDLFALARYNADGTPDTNFSGDGKQTTDFGGFDDQATGVALQGDGKIVVVGGGANGDFALARYNPNGSLDTSFSGDGKQTADFGGSDGATGVALQGDGKIVAVGGSGGDFALARYNSNGSLDPSFSGDGLETTDFGDVDEAAGVALQGDGKIVAVGRAFFVTASFFALARYNPNGSLDTSFSGDGMQTTGFVRADRATGVALQGDGKIVAVGTGGCCGDSSFALARYNPNGSLDPSFSGDGRQTTDFGGFDEANGVALQGDGKLVAVGTGTTNFALARYNPNGSLDPTFSGDGKQVTDFGGADGANGVALQGDGKIVAAGVGFGTDGTIDFALARYLGG